jgi:hypothetical protein
MEVADGFMHSSLAGRHQLVVVALNHAIENFEMLSGIGRQLRICEVIRALKSDSACPARLRCRILSRAPS